MTPVYTSVLDAPLDEYTVHDLGDENSSSNPPPSRVTMSAQITSLRNAAPALIVPFTRTITLGSYGPDVVGAKRALWRANDLSMATRFTRVFGPIAVDQLRKFQHRHGLPADGQLGQSTLKKLGCFFDRYAFLLYTGYPPGGTREQKIRNAITAYATWGYNERFMIHYAEFRPMQHMSDLEHLPETEDCSTFATKAYKFGGAIDPNRMNYDGYGNTGTMRPNGMWISLSAAKPGDLCHYDGPQHVAVYVGGGRVISHGSEIGPLLSLADYRPLAGVQRYRLY